MHTFDAYYNLGEGMQVNVGSMSKLGLQNERSKLLFSFFPNAPITTWSQTGGTYSNTLQVWGGGDGLYHGPDDGIPVRPREGTRVHQILLLWMYLVLRTPPLELHLGVWR